MSSIATADECFACKTRLCRFAAPGGLRKSHRTIELARGERVDNCGADGCMKLWTVVGGTAAVCTTLPDGRRQITGIEHVGNTICGPMAGDDSPTWIEALEPCTICEQDFSSQMKDLQHNAEFLSVMFMLLHKRLANANRHLTTLGRLDSTERVILFLAETARAWTGAGPVHLPMSRDEIADYLGLNAETVSRIFSRVRKSGLFKFISPTEFVVPDFAAIERRLPVAVRSPPTNPIPHNPQDPSAAPELEHVPAKESAT